MLSNNHSYSPEDVRNIAIEVSSRWQQLMTHAEDRHKLVMSSLNFFKTADQVMSVLDSLGKQYRCEEDFCGATLVQKLRLNTPGSGVASGSNLLETPDVGGDKKMAQIISKHQEQKEAFLKATTLARRNGESFLKYASRCIQYYHVPTSAVNQRIASCTTIYRNAESKVKGILENILEREDVVLEHWSSRKKRLDECQQYVLVEHSARQALKWIREVGDDWLHSQVSLAMVSPSSTSELNERYKSLTEFRSQVKETKEKVRLLIQLSENLIEKGHIHSPSIKYWCSLVENNFKDFVRKLDQYRYGLEEKLGLRKSVLPSVQGHHHSGQASSSSSLAGGGSSGTGTLTSISSGSEVTERGSASTTTSLPGDRSSDSSLESKLSGKFDMIGSGSIVSPTSSIPSTGPSTSTSIKKQEPSSTLPLPSTDSITEARRKSTRKKEFIMAELIQTERTYIRDLDTCIQTYLISFRNLAQCNLIPKILVENEKILFGNIEEIFDFHSR